MPARPNPVVVLAEQLIVSLRAARDQGGNDYPLTLSRLRALLPTDAPADVQAGAVKHRTFAAQVCLAQKKHADSPVALAEDVQRLASSSLLLDWLLAELCTPNAPSIPLDKLVKKVDAPLREAFRAEIERQVAEGTLPEPVGVASIKNKPHLFLKRMPPSKPPDLALVERLLQALESQRDESAGFPRTLEGLLSEAAAGADDKLVKKVLGSKLLKPRILLAAKGPAAPVALVEDADRLLASPGLLEFALNSSRTPDNQAIAVKDLPKRVNKGLQAQFKQALANHLVRQTLPAGVGVLAIKKQLHFFFWRDAGGQPPTAVPAPAGPAGDCSALFEAAFDRLNRQSGSVNLVSLVDLRRAMPVDRATFDQQLRELRHAGRFGLSAAEGRHGLSLEEREAAIQENGAVLLFVTRRT